MTIFHIQEYDISLLKYLSVFVLICEFKSNRVYDLQEDKRKEVRLFTLLLWWIVSQQLSQFTLLCTFQ